MRMVLITSIVSILTACDADTSTTCIDNHFGPKCDVNPRLTSSQTPTNENGPGTEGGGNTPSNGSGGNSPTFGGGNGGNGGGNGGGHPVNAPVNQGPVPGQGISFFPLSPSETQVSWGPASNGPNVSGSMYYTLVCALGIQPMMNTANGVHLAAANPGSVVIPWGPYTTITVYDLLPGTTYTCSVIVQDALGRQNAYPYKIVSTPGC